MKDATIAFIGAGNMAAALISGLIADGVPPDRLLASDPDQERLQQLAHTAGVRTLQDNDAAVRAADVVVLAVKPQVLQRVAKELASAIGERRPLVISIAAGVRSDTLARWLGGNVPLVRSMPNTPAMLQAGATALYATAEVNESQRELAESILRAVGLVQWIEDEGLMDAVTALSGSGPAYFFLFMETLEKAAEKLGLPADTARLLTLQTALGAARMAIEAGEDPAELRRRVTSPGGTTERAIASFEKDDLAGMVERALTAARNRSVELSRVLDGEEE
ncbi:MAG: pyrroline-5-carboxylate reductase [Gammaproteobacteria bacterium]|nr:MAG: pyrroline-5-carboxylate reductase [Gammaproteobacteria bacterium]